MAKKPSQLTRVEKFSEVAIRQQQVAWIVYIAEGYLANLEHARTVNNFLMFSDDVTALDAIIEKQRAAVARMRRDFFGE